MAWQNDVNYSDERHGTERVLTFPDIDTTAAAGIKGKIVLTEDIRITEAGMWVTTIAGTNTVTVVVKNSDLAATIATVTGATDAGASSASIGLSTAQTTITNATAAVSGQSITVETSGTTETSGVVQVYVKYLSADYN